MIAADGFMRAMRAAGLNPPAEIIADGRLRRFATSGRRGDDAGWYVLHGDGIPAGAFGCWRSGISGTWRADIGRRLTPAEERVLRERIEQARLEAEALRERGAHDAATRAAKIWRVAQPAPADHPYLRARGIRPHGVRIYHDDLVIGGMQCDGALVIPLRDTGGEIQTVEFIAADGEKRFLPGGRTTGAYAVLGTPGDPIIICEGWATGAAIHEATGHAVRCAMSAGNLRPVAEAIRARAPQARIIIAGDHDASGTGQRAAEDAARAVGGCVALPERAGTDWCDIYRAQGAEAVRRGIAGAREVQHEGASDASGARVELIVGAAVRPEPIRWTWDGWIAAGKLHVVAGAPEAGKTSIALALAATLTAGGRWPDGTRATPGRVVVWSGEDSVEDVLVPRLIALGADLDRVRFVSRVADAADRMRPFDPATDMPLLGDTLRDSGADLLIVDPIVSAVAGDSHENARVRRALQPIVDLADAVGCAVLGISHFSKGTAGRDPVERVTGSVAFGALPRLVFAAAKRPEADGGGRIFVRAKSNIGPSGGGYAYDIEACDIVGGIRTSRLLWAGALDGSARELLATAETAEGGDLGSIAEAKEFLRGLLADGPVLAKQVERDADGAGFAWRTVQEAARRLGVERRKVGMREGWQWALPKMQGDPKMHEGANPESLHLRASSADLAPSGEPGVAEGEVV